MRSAAKVKSFSRSTTSLYKTVSKWTLAEPIADAVYYRKEQLAKKKVYLESEVYYMKTRKLRLLSALLALAMLLALLPTAAFAEDPTKVYNCGKNGAEVIATLDTVTGTLTISGSGKMADYNSNGSPWSVNVKKAIQTVVIGKDVTSIGNCAFYNTTELTSVTFEGGSKLTNIGQAAFGSCRKLTSITIPFSVTTIGANAFEWCSGLQSVTFAPNSGLQTIGTEAFEDCHKDLIIYYSNNEVKQALTNAGVSAGIIKPANPTVTFDSKGGSDVAAKPVKNGDAISAPDAPTKDGYIFAGWYTDEALTEKYDFSKAVKDDMTLYAKWIPGGTCGVGGNLTWTLDGGTLTISGSGAMKDYSGVSGRPWNNRSADIRTVVIENDVTRIGDRAFAGCESLATVNLPENGKLEKIGFNAFGNYNSDRSAPIITKIAIPASVKVIDAYAFKGCEKLGTVTFAPDSKLELINGWAFQGTALTQITIPASITTFDGEAFKDCKKLEEVTFEAPSGLCEENDNISDNAFTGCTKLSKINCEAALQEKLASKLPADVKPAFNITDATDSGSDTNPETYSITIDYGTAYDADHNVITKAAAGETVYVEASETALDGMAFERWEVRKGEVTLENDRAAKTSFTMPEGEVQLEAMYQAAEVHDSGWDAATVVTGAVIGTGTAILAYHIGMEVYAEQVLGKDVAVPRTRAEVALLAWQLAGSPAVNVEGEPLSEAAQAEKWAVESGLMQKDAEGNFNGTKKMSKWNALRTLDAAKKMG